ncbi:UDP-N-acetylmuramoyl-tripeptide--D-alanyl-D-alanine ligase [Lentibacillus salinarum]|uniref:UDP-N-acetylmuramoyl-tripeptide--D-alanyl-D-alanine ligase n=1 Tax=Lentibacillus salinarum TaxID=446820 RepID=A0ABW3ZQ43_9BACI
MLFTTDWLGNVLADNKEPTRQSIEIAEVATDSRKKTENALFVPLTGDRFDGHDYLEEAINQGAVAVLWNQTRKLPDFLPPDFLVFFVEDTLSALQQLALAYRDKVNPAVIGITGSNGKTTTKDLIASVVGTSFKTHHTKGNLNNQIGVPLTILAMPPDTEALVVEMGMNHAGEIETLSNIAKPDYAVITNIGESHIEYLGSREGIAAAKLEIVKGMASEGHLLIDGDELLLKRVRQRHRVMTCGFDSGNDVFIKQVNLTRDATRFQLSDGGEYTIPLLGSHHALNATFAVTIARLLDIAGDKVRQGLAALAQTSMRFEILNGRNGSSIINDAYNASPTSMKASINVVNRLEGFRQKVLVLGDIFELGEQSKPLHRSVADSIDHSVDAVLTCGDESAEIASAVKHQYPSVDSRHFTSKQALLNALEAYVEADTLLLFKASRGMQFESLVEQFLDPS